MLEADGYEVVEAESGRDALAFATNGFADFDLLVADVVMPAMNGKDLANRLCLHRPDLKVLFVSAYSKGILTSHGLCPDLVELLKKPFNKQELLSKVRGVLEGKVSWADIASGES